MSSPFGDPLLTGLQAEVEQELQLVESSHPADASVDATSPWQFDPTEAAREDVRLRSLLGAVEVMEGAGLAEPEGPR
jgi:hypothetical protein